MPGATAQQRVDVQGQCGNERLAFTGLHLGDRPAVQDQTAENLCVEMPHVDRALAGLANDGKGLGQQVVEGLSLVETLAESRRARRHAITRAGIRNPSQQRSFINFPEYRVREAPLRRG